MVIPVLRNGEISLPEAQKTGVEAGLGPFKKWDRTGGWIRAGISCLSPEDSVVGNHFHGHAEMKNNGSKNHVQINIMLEKAEKNGFGKLQLPFLYLHTGILLLKVSHRKKNPEIRSSEMAALQRSAW